MNVATKATEGQESRGSRRKKLIAVALVGVGMTVAAFSQFGTFAAWIDQDDNLNNSISTGKFDIEWTDATGTPVETPYITVSGLRPGGQTAAIDAYLTNQGDAKADVQITSADLVSSSTVYTLDDVAKIQTSNAGGQVVDPAKQISTMSAPVLNIEPGATVKVSFVISMELTADNNYQNKSLTFTLRASAVQSSESSPSPSPSPAP